MKDELISRQAAIDALWTERQKLEEEMQRYLENEMPFSRAAAKTMRNRVEEDIEIISHLPAASNNVHDLPKDADTLSRKAVIDAIDRNFEAAAEGIDKRGSVYGILRAITGINKCSIGQLPSAQPEISMEQIKIWLDMWEGYIDKDIIARMKYRVIDIPLVNAREVTE